MKEAVKGLGGVFPFFLIPLVYLPLLALLYVDMFILHSRHPTPAKVISGKVEIFTLECVHIVCIHKKARDKMKRTNQNASQLR